jgi:hypothetical protein
MTDMCKAVAMCLGSANASRPPLQSLQWIISRLLAERALAPLLPQKRISCTLTEGYGKTSSASSKQSRATGTKTS